MRGIGIVKGLNLSIVQGGSHANQNQTRSLNKMAARCDRLRRLSTNTSRYLAHHRQPAATPCDLSQVAPVDRVNEGERELIMMRWGMPTQQYPGITFNIGNTSSPH